MSSMVPNYVVLVVSAAFLAYTLINVVVRKAKLHNPLVYGISVAIAVLLIGMCLYGILFNIPLGQVQAMIESKWK